MEEYIKEAESLLMHTYSRYQIILDRGEGVYLYDTNGKKYLDFGAGIAVFALGYGNREYNDALKAQLDKLIHTSNYFYNVPSVKAASKFTKASGMDRVFFTNSGTEAIEGAIKLARKYYYKKHQRGDSQIIAMNRSFHGRSMGALSVTGQPSYREAFEPLIGGVVFADLNSIEDIKAKINDRTCAILLEPVQAEGGVYPAGEEYLKELKKLCEERDILLIFDEIQCGMGRCGSMFVWQEYGVKPDILTSAKALGCGVPVGAFGAVEKVCMAFEPGDHGTTYGGNPFTAAAVNAVFDQYEKLDLLNHVKEISSYLELQLDELAKSHNAIKERRGKGLLQGLEFEYPVKDIILKAMDNNLILFSAGSNVLRFVPPLVITREHVDEMIEILKKVIS
ncbi:acetylornithine/N-succinyldiaminopimelate aminotransferase [Anaerocolumna jejuensis DSM 15929]|uniref:Acetylornithine/N-succinyldiaminopimelate aminotransferase n=1 Tax=Anaerocolumna jejuensis DSM 15929 TaxID=1121322 RepID=A0A1M6MQ55_9FIRM|nr:aspartate aminotransferase family protein [Anaerocolumna jejuensis]SHJ85597.1 acetylornithine/N-succinyldiaminopimelate aminotransferase [Anaerocolumna jejuensis DSM 15929]